MKSAFHLAMVLAALAWLPQPSAANAAADEMAELLGRWESLGLRFVQHTYNEKRQLIERRKGRVWIKKPRRFRLTIEKPDEEISVSDGDRFWLYDPLLKQVQQGRLQNRWETAPLLLISDDPRKLEASWSISASGRRSRREFVLRPRSKEVLFQKITLSFKADIPAELKIVDNLDQLVQLKFSRPERNPDLDDSVFIFVPPADADVIIDEPASAK